MKFLLLAAFTGVAFGQTILPGDACFSAGSYVWPSPQMQWGPNFTCSVTLPAGNFDAVFTFQEPGNAPPIVNGPGQRIFTVGFGGQTSAPIDIFAQVGNGPLVLKMQGSFLSAGTKVLTFKATVRNAIVRSVVISPTPPPPVIITSAAQFASIACPVGYTGARLSDGTCLVVIPLASLAADCEQLGCGPVHPNDLPFVASDSPWLRVP